MKLLNLGCGGQRPQDEHWFNCDNLREQLAIGTPERTNLDAEPRYYECNLLTQDLPFPDNYFDGIVLVHVLEHFTCHDSVMVLEKCRRVLKPDSLLVASVPNASYFLEVNKEDTKENAVELFGEPIHDAGFEKFFDYALFRHDHKQVLTKDSLLCLMIKAGLKCGWIQYSSRIYVELEELLNRRKFSIEALGLK